MSNTEYLFSYQCGGKANIYDTYQKVINVPSHGVALFFVDKDFSDILHETYPIAENIYVTDFYSIENYLVSEDMLTRIWNELFHFPKAMISIKSTQSKFRLELEHFYNVFLPLMAWIISLRRSGLKPNLNNINLSNIFFINDDLSLEKRGEASNIDEIEILEKMCGVTTTQECRSNIDSIAQELANLVPKMYIRGKFEMWFFVKFTEKLTRMLQRAISDRGGKMGVKTQITEGNAIEVLGPRLQIPLSLEKFLHQNMDVLDLSSKS